MLPTTLTAVIAAAFRASMGFAESARSSVGVVARVAMPYVHGELGQQDRTISYMESGSLGARYVAVDEWLYAQV